MRRRFALLLSLLLSAFVLQAALVGCKKKPKTPKKSKKKTAKDIKNIKKWANPGCKVFHQQMVKLCGDFLKKKKRTAMIKKEPFLKGCIKLTVENPRTMYRRLRCAAVAPSCPHLRHCNKCGSFFCPKWKKGPKVPKIKGLKKAPAKKADKSPPAKGGPAKGGPAKKAGKKSPAAPGSPAKKAPKRAPAKKAAPRKP